MKRIKEIPPDMRPREKLIQNGVSSLSDLELLTVIIGKGSKNTDVISISKKLLKEIDNQGISPNPQSLIKIPGMGTAKAALIASAFEFARRRIKPEGLKIKKPSDILPLIRHYADRKQEHFLSISINGAGEVLNVRVVTIGLINKTQVHPREVFADIISDRASAFIVAHNHPSGSLVPSKEDAQVTQTLKKASSILGINLLDHIIFTPKGYYSFLENQAI